MLNVFFGFSSSRNPAQAQERVIVVNAEQPNIWTLEQAHYLLAQMHRRNLDLRAKKLEDLDANAITGLRFDVLRTLVELGVSFNDANRVTNRMLSRNKEFNSERAVTLTTRRDTLREESLNLTRDISKSESDKARATTQEEKDALDAEIASKTKLRAGIDKEIEFADNELKTLNDGTGDFKSTDAAVEFNKEKFPPSVFDDSFKEAAKTMIQKFNEAPSLNASLMLDNFLNMQYEIIAKQLSLLRDEVGPGERLLFLELPQSVNVTHHEADRKWAQSWWRIAGYTCRERKDIANTDPNRIGCMSFDQARTALANRRPPTTDPKATPQPSPEDNEQPRGMRNNKPIRTIDDYNSILWNKDIHVEVNKPTVTGMDGQRTSGGNATVDYVTKIIDLDKPNSAGGLAEFLKERGATLSNRIVRTVELIPRQSSLNVNDMKLRTQSGAFTAVASFLFGFGTRLNVQRQREQFSQFVQQELYSSAFGKGSREFGWTFTPMPGTERLMSGVRTTYAVVVVPDTATSIVLESNGCYFPRSSYQPNDFENTKSPDWRNENRRSRNCNPGPVKAFVVNIPSAGVDGSNDFFVSGITYSPVPKGERIVVTIYGDNFSSQTGVLVNGVSLTPAIGLAQPLIRDDSVTGERTTVDLKDEKIKGTIERVDTNQIVASFKMSPEFVSTPTISLIAPGKAIDINRLNDLYINSKPNTSLGDSAWMFGKRPVTENFRIDSVEAFRSSPGRVSLMINGAGFLPTPAPATRELFINGVPQSFRMVSSSLIVTDFPAPSDETIQVTLVYDDDAIKSEPVTNPAFLKVNNVAIVSYEPPANKEPGVLVVKIEGTGFTSGLRSTVGSLVVKSPTEAFLTILNPAPAVRVTLYDRRVGFEITTVITRKPPPK
jgi:hypothetical protein